MTSHSGSFLSLPVRNLCDGPDQLYDCNSVSNEVTLLTSADSRSLLYDFGGKRIACKTLPTVAREQLQLTHSTSFNNAVTVCFGTLLKTVNSGDSVKNV